MKYREVMRLLKEAGTAQNRKIYARHGVSGSMYGVSYANLDALAKRLKTDHALSGQLWRSGNHDARVLATRVADPGQARLSGLKAWARDLGDGVLAGALAAYVAKTPHRDRLGAQWRRARGEWVGVVGWTLLAQQAMADELREDAEFLERLAEIESGIHRAPNQVRGAMNMALIAIGGRNRRLRQPAVAAARRIGRVEVDHGQTGCKTPDAEAYIGRIWARREARG